MITQIRALIAAAMLLAPTLFVPGGAAAQTDWPTKLVRAIVPFPAGGATDSLARSFAEALSRELGQTFLIENRSGAAGAIGTDAVAKAAPDGYTILITPANPLTIVPYLRKQLPYAREDLVPVARIGTYVAALGVRPTLPVHTVAELVALAKAQPGKISYATSGYGGGAHIRLEALKLAAGIDMVNVPYKGGSEELTDLLSGNVDAMTENIIFAQAKVGKVRLLAMVSDQRHPDFPDVPTIAEAGYPEMNLPLSFAVFVPKGTPRAIIDRLNAATVKASHDPDLAARMLTIGFSMGFETPEQITKELDDEYALYGKVIRAADIHGE